MCLSNWRLLNSYHGAMDNLIGDPALNRIWHRGLRDFEALDEDDRNLWVTQMHASLRRYENIILQSRKYPVNAGVIAGIQNQWQWLLKQPGSRKFWPKAYSVYSDEFIAFVDQRHGLSIKADVNNAV